MNISIPNSAWPPMLCGLYCCAGTDTIAEMYFSPGGYTNLTFNNMFSLLTVKETVTQFCMR